MKKIGYLLITSCLTASVLSGCSNEATGQLGSGTNGDEVLHIFATTGYLADAAKNIAPDAEITTMVGPGGDPHTYQPTTQDMEKMQDADLVLWNGLHLEAKMIDQLESLGDKQLSAEEKLDRSELLPWPEKGPDGEPLYDPHIWNSPQLWSQVVDSIGAKFAEIDSKNAKKYEHAADDYERRIQQAAKDAESKLDSVSPRVLITGHDAFNYFGKTFDFDVHATDFVTTEATKSPQEISELADTIATRKIPVIFQDNQANPQAIKALKEAVHSRGWVVKISSEVLFADTLGPTSPDDTYIGALNHNATTVAEAFK